MTTVSRNLRTGRSTWEWRRARPSAARRARNAEVLAIGAGITGAMISGALSDASLSVVVVDRRDPAKGSRPRRAPRLSA